MSEGRIQQNEWKMLARARDWRQGDGLPKIFGWREKKNVSSKYQLAFLSCVVLVNSGLRMNDDSAPLVPSSPLHTLS